MMWPHVEKDGVLCLLPNLAEWDPDSPSEVAEDLVRRSVRLIEELLDGTIVERDFREEFLTYWAYQEHLDTAQVVTLLPLAPPSRTVQVWKGHGLEVVGEGAEAVAGWVRNRFGDDCDTSTEEAAFLWLNAAPLPADYPHTAADLWRLAQNAGSEATEALMGAASSEPDHVTVVLAAEGRGGAGAVSVKIPNPKHLRTHPRAAAEPLSRGFRAGRAPQSILQPRFFGQCPVVRGSVQRADAAWVHGRGRDSRTEKLMKSTVVIFGCGSVGAPIACTLAQAGVGRIVIVDYDRLSWPNVGRHPLGATSVGRNKAEALAERLQADFPHLRVEGRDTGLLAFLRTEAALLQEADLIIAATASWSAEHSLNQWHLSNSRQRPILYGWTEAHACAGHAVVIGADGGCLKCHIGRTGVPDFRVVDWPEGGDANQEEPACGAHYQPYGPVELAQVNAMISGFALECLLKPPLTSTSRIYATSAERIAELGGSLTEAWRRACGSDNRSAGTHDRAWPAEACCACGAPLLAKSA